MPFPDEFILRAGSALVGPLYAAWRRKLGKTEQNARTLKELLALDHENLLAQHRIEQDLSLLGEYITSTMVPIFQTDGISLNNEQHNAISIAISDTLAKGGISPDVFYDSDLNSENLFKYYLKNSTSFRIGFSAQENELFEACLREMCNRLLEVSAQFPAMTTRFQRELVSRQSAIYDIGRKTLEKIVEFQEKNRTGKNIILNNFHFHFRNAVKKKMGSIFIFGLEGDDIASKLPLEISYLSLQLHDNKHGRRVLNEEDDENARGISAESFLLHSNRSLILGPAGSGKTTLLQWLCTQIVEKSMKGELSKLNGYTPFFIRLRDFNGRNLPVGDQLIESTSRSLASQAPEGWVREILESEKAVFLIDGLDETTSGNQSNLVQWLSDLLTISPGSYYIVTSRPASSDMSFLKEEKFDEYSLKRMSPKEVREFILYWHAGLKFNCNNNGNAMDVDKKQQQVLHILSESPSLARLSSNPLLCAIICTLNVKSRLRVATSRTDLYKTSVRLLIHERDSLRGVSDPIYDALTYDEKEKFLSEVAYWLVRNGKTTIAHEEYYRILSRFIHPQQIERWLQSIPSSSARKLALRSDSDPLKIAELVGCSLLIRSGLLQPVGFEEIQFIHKTFQEYLASISIRWNDDEEGLIKTIDIRKWNELIILLVTTTTRRKSEIMLDLLIQRGVSSSNEDEKSYCYLLAASCLRETYGLSDEIKLNVINHLKGRIPPNSPSAVAFLAGAGDIVVPLLRFSSSFPRERISYTIEALSYINTTDSRRALLEYAEKFEVNDFLIEALCISTTYIEDDEFVEAIVSSLISRNSAMFFRESQRSKCLRIANRDILQWLDFIPKFNVLQVDGIRSKKMINAIKDEYFNDSAASCIYIMNINEPVQTDSLKFFRKAREINFIAIYSVISLDFLSQSSVSIIRFINVPDISDVDGIQYSNNIKEIYLEDVEVSAAEEILRRVSSPGIKVFIGSRLHTELLDSGYPPEFKGSAHMWKKSDIDQLSKESRENLRSHPRC